MITAELLKQYKRHNGDLDSWSRKHSTTAYEDWRLIESLIQNLWLMKQNQAGEQLIERTRELMQTNFEDPKARKMLLDFAEAGVGIK